MTWLVAVKENPGTVEESRSPVRKGPTLNLMKREKKTATRDTSGYSNRNSHNQEVENRFIVEARLSVSGKSQNHSIETFHIQ
jgi:hypothetical protein